ncbi:MAG TPA: TVP38/TMEM64 family protein [Thermoanaerobaculia bacterium]|nr:TVP38/TMEM64 family protein [Thermoanaerobaculia bacterium]
MSEKDSALRRPRARRAFQVFGVAACLLVAIAALSALELGDRLPELVERVRALGWAGPPLFVLLHAISVVVLLPGVLFPVTAGVLFGWTLGAVLSVAGKALGATVAFQLARAAKGRVAPERARRALSRYPLLQRIDQGLSHQGWRLVALVRMIPIIPFKLSNYLFGWTRFTLRDYVLGTLIGVIPFSLSNAYLGSLAAGLAGGAPDGAPDGGVVGTPWLWAAIGLTATAAALVATRRALHILERATEDGGEAVRSDAPRGSARPSPAREG